MKIFHTSDQHFDHTNVIKYTGRNFLNADEMNAAYIVAWNRLVGADDIVYHLGDLTLKNTAHQYIRELNGKILILGNPWHHDGRWLEHYMKHPDLYISASGHPLTVLPPLVVAEYPDKGCGKYPLVVNMCHYPLHTWDRKHYGAWHLHGHSHGNAPLNMTDPNGAPEYVIDVGVDVWAGEPVELTRIRDIFYDERAQNLV